MIQKLQEELFIEESPKDYRKLFSQAYQFLYNDGQQNYLTEILDAAQEGFPYLFVNGQKLSFNLDIYFLKKYWILEAYYLESSINFNRRYDLTIKKYVNRMKIHAFKKFDPKSEAH